VLAYNYGEAAAIDYLGTAQGLPKAISGHNQYALWGPGGYTGAVVIAIGFSQQQLRDIFDEVSPAMRVTSQYAIPEEANLTIYLCGKPRKKLPDLWAKLMWLG
jgi:hypothetical protein